MAYSVVSYPGNGSSTDFTVPFPYISPTDIFVSMAGSAVPFTFLSSSTVRCTTAPPVGGVLTIRRVTSKTTSPANFTDGSVLLATDLDALARFSLYTAQENYDLTGAFIGGGAPSSELPPVIGQAGKYLGTDGSAIFWDTPAGDGGPSSYSGIAEFDPYNYGCVGDGRLADSVGMQLCLNAASEAGGVMIVPPGTFSVGVLNIQSTGLSVGLRALSGRGGKILLQPVLNAGIRMLGTFPSGAAANVQDCAIEGLYIDAQFNPLNTVPIWCMNPGGARIQNNTIVNMAHGTGIVVRNYIGANAGGGNRVERNKVFGNVETDPSVKNWDGIAVDCEVAYDLVGGSGVVYHTGAAAQWKDPAFTVPRAPCNAAIMGARAVAYQSGNTISGNYVVGAYYGISLAGTVYSTVSGNTLASNIRGISSDHSSSGNLITTNRVLDNLSAGIHLAYGSCFNKVSSNSVYTTRGTIEACIQAYVGCEDNTIDGNTITSFAAGGPKAAVYVAVHGSRNRIMNNDIRGNFLRAGIAVESAWVDTTAGGIIPAAEAPFTYSTGTTGTNGFARGAGAAVPYTMEHVLVKGNVITLTNGTASALYFGAWTDTVTGAAALKKIRVEDNSVLSAAATSGHPFQLRIYCSASQAAGFVVVNNTFSQQCTTDEFVISAVTGLLYENRNNLHLSSSRVAEILTRMTPATTTRVTNSPVPSVLIGGELAKFVNTVPTLVTNFSNGENGQFLMVEMDVFTGIKHTPSQLILKGGVDIPVSTRSANDIICFKRLNDAWYEVSRSW